MIVVCDVMSLIVYWRCPLWVAWLNQSPEREVVTRESAKAVR